MARTDFRTALESSNEIEIAVTGRTSGRSRSYPVWFALKGETLALLPAKGSDTQASCTRSTRESATSHAVLACHLTNSKEQAKRERQERRVLAYSRHGYKRP